MYNETLTLSNGVEIPCLALGTWQVNKEQAHNAALQALSLGYRHIDTAFQYYNEEQVGQAINRSQLDREEVFLASKIQAGSKEKYEAAKQIDEILYECRQDYLDLILIHAPRPWALMDENPSGYSFNKENAEVWSALEEAYEAGKVRAIGVSNFEIEDLDYLLAHCRIKPMVNQIKYHIGSKNTDDVLVNYCKDHGMVVEGFSPLGTGQILDNADIKKLADKYQKTAAQIAVRYVLQKGLVVLPRSTKKARIQENAEVDFEISAEDMQALDAIKLD